MNDNAYSAVATNPQTGVQTAAVINTASSNVSPDIVTGSNLTVESFYTTPSQLVINTSDAQIQLSAGGNVAVVGENGQPIILTGATGATVTSNATTINYQIMTPQGGIITEQANIGSAGSGTLSTIQNGQTSQQTFATAAQEYGEVGATFGSSLGRVLAGSNSFAQISASTVLGELGQVAGQLIAAETSPGIDVEASIDQIVSGNAILQGVEGQGIGAITAYLIGDLFKDIGLTGAPAQVVQSLASQTTAQIATNLINEAAGEINPATNAVYTWSDGINLGASLGNIAGGFVGTELGNLVYSASTVQGQEGASVGSAVGGVIGSFIPIPVVGTAIGSFVGDIIGGLIGDLFGEPNTSAISLASLQANGSATTPLSYSFTTSLYQNGSQASATSIGDAVSGALNGVLAAVGGVVANEPSLTQFTVGINTDSSLGQVFYYDDNSANARTQYQASDTTLQWVVDYSTLRELSEMAFSGGDPYIERAIDAGLRAAVAPDMNTMSGDIQIAKDYETYEANKTVINALMEANPTTDFTAGWVAELAIAASMGYGTSIQGGTDNDTLDAAGAQKILIGGGGDDTYVDGTGDGQVTILNGVSYNNIAVGILQLNEQGLYYDANEHDTSGNGLTNLTFTQRGADLVIGLNGSTTDGVTLEGWFAGSFAEIGQISLADGTIIDLAAIQGYVGQESEELIGPNQYAKYATDNIGIENANSFSNSGAPIAGGVGDDVLVGGTGANTFITGGGIDIAYGGGGSDTYQFNGVGLLAIYNNINDSGAVMGTAASGMLSLGGGVTANQLSFSQNGNDIDITINGLGSEVTVANWFANAYSQLSDITTSDGNTIYYSTSNGGQFWYEDTAFTYGIHSYFYWNVAGFFISQDYYYDAVGDNYETVTQNTATTWTYGLEANVQITIADSGSIFNVTAAGTDTVTFNETNATLNFTGAGDTINVTGASDVINASGDTITLAAGVAATINGTGNTINAGNGDTINATNATIIVNSGVLIAVNYTNPLPAAVVNEQFLNASGQQTTNWQYSNYTEIPTVDAGATSNAAWVERSYLALLNRQADPGGFQGSLEDLDDGSQTRTSLAAIYLSSAEYQADYGTQTDAQFVTFLYNNVLGRAPDSGGYNVYTGALAAGASRATIAEDFLDSAEALNHWESLDGGAGTTANGTTIDLVTITNTAVGGNTPSGQYGFGAGITASDLVFTQSGNDLLISVLGSTQQVKVVGWFANSYSQLQSLNFTDGTSLSTSAISALVGDDTLASAILNGTYDSGQLPSFETSAQNNFPASIDSTTSVVGGGQDFFGTGQRDVFLRTAGQPSVWQFNSAGQLTGSLWLTYYGGPVGIDTGTTIVGAGEDFFGQGQHDLFVRGGDGQLHIWQFNSAGQYSAGLDLTNNSAGLIIDNETTVVGGGEDYFGQGQRVIFARGGDGQLDIWQFNSAGQYSGGQDLTNNSASLIIDNETTVVGGGEDYFGQGQRVIFVRGGNGQLDIWQFNSAGQYSGGQDLTNNSASLIIDSGTTVVGGGEDYFGQGQRDVFLRASNGQLDIWQINSAGQYSRGLDLTNNNAPLTIDTATTVVGAGEDFFGAGQKDIFVRGSNGQLYVWQANSSGQLTNSIGFTNNNAPLTIDTATTIVGAGEDFFGSGQKDIFVRGSNGALYVWQSNNSGQLTGAATFTYDGAPVIIDTGTTVVGAGEDFLGSGEKDVFLRNSAGQLILWQFNSSGQLDAGIAFTNSNGTAFTIDTATAVIGAGHDSVDGETALKLQYGNGTTAIVDVSNGVVSNGPSGGLLDPLVLNLSGGAVETSSQADSGVTFDMRGDGAQQNTGWITRGEGFLVADPTGAAITSRAQMFSDLLVPDASSGLAALATYDSNGDGKITAADAKFDDIEVWVPGANGSAGNLYTLDQLGITAIDLQKTAIDAMNNGNEILNGFSFQYANGTTGQGAEVGFAVGQDLTAPDTAMAKLVQAMASLTSSDSAFDSLAGLHVANDIASHITLAAASH